LPWGLVVFLVRDRWVVHWASRIKVGRYLLFALLVLFMASVSCDFAWDNALFKACINPLNAELNPICCLLALLGTHHFLYVSRIRVKSSTLRLLMSYMYGAPILDVSRSHTTTHHSRYDSSGRVISSSQRPGGTSREVNARIQKARGSFSKVRGVWLSKSLRKDTKIRIFSACVKSVLLYGCEIWLVTNEIQRKIQTFVNRCLRYVLRIWWPNIISNKDQWKVTGQEDINSEIRKKKFRWIGHTLRKEDGEIPKAALLWNP